MCERKCLEPAAPSLSVASQSVPRWLAFCNRKSSHELHSQSGVLLSVPLAVLTDLNLMLNCIGDDGARAIAEALKVNPVLTKLYLNNNNLGDAGEKAVREAVKDRSGFELGM